MKHGKYISIEYIKTYHKKILSLEDFKTKLINYYNFNN